MNKQSFNKRLRFLSGNRTESSKAASVTLGNASSEEKAIVAFAFPCCEKLRVLVKRFAWRLKSRLKRSRKSDNNNIQYSYDLRSYYLNFDDGLSRRR
ncbi:unnamed protein product [Cochlearia groenlandica]